MPDHRRLVRAALWCLPVWTALLFLSTLTHQPPPQTRLAEWSDFVTTPVFLASHLVGSILGAAAGTVGLFGLGTLLVGLGRPRSGAWGIALGTVANTLLTSLFGVAAFAQPAIGRLYRSGDHATAQRLYEDAAQGPWLVTTGLLGVVLMTAALVVLGVAVARTTPLPRWAGLALAVGGPLFALVGFALDDAVQSVGAALLTAGAVGTALGARGGAPAPGPGAAQPTASR
jgi:hypothetical protein